ncbi:MAG: hypothetical protein IKB96_12315 [Prevotella sp.]|nr:hypothetical protein [Prevotella sp.]
MAEIVVTLLLNKRTYQTINDLNVQVASSPDYAVVAGENAVTQIQVNYPERYAALRCYVRMRNAKGEYATVNFTGSATAKTFTLPDTMTYAGNTVLTFYAVNTSTGATTVWVPVIIPITATGVDYHEVAKCSEDMLEQALARLDGIETAEATRKTNEDTRIRNEAARIVNENNRINNETGRTNTWNTLRPQMEQIIADTAAAQAAAQTVNEIYSQMSMTLCYDDEGYPCYAEEE